MLVCEDGRNIELVYATCAKLVDFRCRLVACRARATEISLVSNRMDIVRVRMTTDGRGRGLFSTAEVASGSLVFEEKAIACGFPLLLSDLTDDFDGRQN